MSFDAGSTVCIISVITHAPRGNCCPLQLDLCFGKQAEWVSLLLGSPGVQLPVLDAHQKLSVTFSLRSGQGDDFICNCTKEFLDLGEGADEL